MTQEVKVIFKAKWQFKEYTHYKITTCKKVVNTQTNRLIKKTKSGGSVGFNIAGNFFKLSDINKHIEIIPKKVFLPF
jgi:hypothetical protein